MEAYDRQNWNQRLVGVVDQTLRRMPATDPLLYLRMVKLRERLVRESDSRGSEPPGHARAG